jgi:O-methyltransferase
MKTLIRSIFGAMGLDIYRSQNPAHDFYPRNMTHAQTSYETDLEFHRLYDLAQQKTQMQSSDNAFRRQRHYTLFHLLRNLDGLAGDFCELGCWRGLSAYQTATYVRRHHVGSHFCILDSFEGLSEYKDEDKTGRSYDFEAMRKALACPEDIVKANLGEFDFMSYHKGWIPTQFHEVIDRRFIWVHVDVDLYQPIRDSSEFFFPKLVPGGIMLFDDYGYAQFPGAKKAVDEFVSTLPPTTFFFQPLVTGQAILVKSHGA